MKPRTHRPYLKFKGWLRENNLTYSDVAALLGINQATVALKINGYSDFLLSEIQALKNEYHLDSDIFFTNDVAQTITKAL